MRRLWVGLMLVVCCRAGAQRPDLVWMRGALEGDNRVGGPNGYLLSIRTRVSPDGKLLASATGTIKLWRLADSMVIRTLGTGQNVAFSSDGKTLFASEDSALRAYSVPDGKVLLTTQLDASVISLDSSPDGQMVAAGMGDGSIRFLSVATLAPTGSLAGHTAQVISVRYSPDNQYIASNSADQTNRVCRLSDGQIVLTNQPYNATSNAGPQFTPDGKLLVAVVKGPDNSRPNYIVAYRTSDWSVAAGIPWGAFSVPVMALSPDSSSVALGIGSSVNTFRLSDGSLIAGSNISMGFLTSLTYFSNGQNILVTDGDARYGDGITSSAVLNASDLSRVGAFTTGTFAGLGDVVGLAVSPTGRHVAYGTSSFVLVRDTVDGSSVQPVPELSRSPAFSPDGNSVAVVGSGYIRIWRIADWTPLLTIQNASTDRIAYSPDGKFIAAEHIGVFSAIDGSLVKSLPDLSISLTFSPDGHYLTSYTGAIYRTSDWEVERYMDLRGNSIAFSPDSSLVAVGSSLGVSLYSVATGSLIRTLIYSNIYTIAFSPDGQVILAHTEAGLQFLLVADGSTLSLYNQELITHPEGGHVGGGFQPVAYSPDGRTFFYGRSDGTVCCALNPYRNAIFPSKGGNTGNVTVKIITPDTFPVTDGTTVTLRDGVHPDILVTATMMNPHVLTMTFDLRGAPVGMRDLVISVPGGGATTYPQGFTIEQSLAASYTSETTGWSNLRVGGFQGYEAYVFNNGNIDGQPADLRVEIPKDFSWLGGEFGGEFQGEHYKSVAVPLPVIPAGTGENFPLKIMASPASGAHAPFTIAAWVNTGPEERLVYIGDGTENPGARLVAANGDKVDLLTARAAGGGFRLAAAKVTNLAGDWTAVSVDTAGRPAAVQTSSGYSATVSWLTPLSSQVTVTQPGGSPGGSYGVSVSNGTFTSPPPSRALPGVDMGCVWYHAAMETYCTEDVQIWLGRASLIPGIGQGIGYAGQGLAEACRNFHQSPQNDCSGFVFFYGQTITAGDPNDLSGPTGYGPDKWVNVRPLTYLAMFENVPTATAPVAKVVVTDHIDATKFDTTSLQIGTITVMGKSVTPSIEYALPIGVRKFDADIDLRPEKEMICRVHCELDTLTGDLTWTFTSIDPATGLPPTDPIAGFLDPGQEGSCLFSVLPKAGQPTGTVLTNQATIVFDYNDPMNTPIWANTLDSDAPVTQVAKLSSTQKTSKFTVKWVAADVGSGLKGTDVLVSTDGGPYETWISSSTATSATFTGLGAHTYRFYSVGRDNAGNVEAAPDVADASTKVLLCVDNVRVMPSTVGGSLTSTGTVTLTGPPSADALITLSSSSPGVATVPATVTIPAGQVAAAFPITTHAVTAITSITIGATWNGIKKTTTLQVRPVAPLSLSFNPTSVKPLKTATGMVTLEAPAEPSGVKVTLISSSPHLTVPQSVTIPQGATSGTFTAQAGTTTAAVTAKVTASTAGGSKATSVRIVANGVASLVVSPTTVQGGTDSNATITLDVPAAANTTLALSSSNASAAWFVDSAGTPIASAAIPTGQQSVVVKVRTAVVIASVKVTLKALANGVGKTAALTVKQ